MKAICVRQFDEPDVMKLKDVAELIPDKGQAVVKLHAIGVNPVDTYCRSGVASWVSLPFTPGVDGAGVIRQLAWILKN